MLPAFSDGELIQVDPDAYRIAEPEVGDVVLARHPFKGDVHLIKRVSHVDAQGRFFVVGDNPEGLASTDSRSFGALDRARILGKVVGRAT